MSEVVARRLRIHGRVQGVGYRAWFERTARSMNLIGWVRNREDGTVEALVKGSEPDVAILIEAAHEGPAYASVSKVEVFEAMGLAPDRFEIKPTV